MSQTLMIYFNQTIALLYQTNKNLLEKAWVELLIRSYITLFLLQNTNLQVVAAILNHPQN